MKTKTSTRIEALESRIAPAGLVISGAYGRTATYTDVDGDIVTVTTSKGTFTPGHFHFGPQNALGGQQLEMLNLLDAEQQAQFNNADITFSAHKGPKVGGGLIGDDSVNLGYLQGSRITHPTASKVVIEGVDLKTFTLPGDVGKIMLGDKVQSTTIKGSTPVNHTEQYVYPAVTYIDQNGNVTGVRWAIGTRNALTVFVPYTEVIPDFGNIVLVKSIGGAGLLTGAPDLSSTVVGTSALFVDGDVKEAKIEYFGKYGTCGITIGGSLLGGTGDGSGQIIFHQNGFVVISGNIMGGDGRGSGTIVGGEFDYTNPDIQDITGLVLRLELGHDLVGGHGDDSGQVLFAKATTAGRFAGITIQGSIIGGEGDRSGLISSLLDIRDLEIGGDIIGGAGNGSGGIHAGQEKLVAGNTQAVQIADADAMVKGKIGAAIIHGSIIGGSNASTTQRLDRSGFIEAAEIGTLTIEGSVVAGTDAGGGLSSSGSIRADKTITKLWVKGLGAGVVGGLIGNATNNVIISAGNKITTLWVGVEATNAAKTILNHANVSYTSILAGYQHDTSTSDLGDAANADADIGTVRITGNFTASNIIAGVQTGADLLFGTADDASIVGGVDVRANKSTIANIVIRGAVVGTAATGDHFGIVAEKITRVEIGGVVQALTSALNSINLLDLTIKEVV